MTIINPAKNKNITLFIIFAFAFVLLGGGVYIYEYNALANARYELDTLKQKRIDVEAKNAELKNEFYAVTDAAKLREVASEYNLMIENKPQYITLSK
ncbi:hypothetical protein A3I34_02745 [Candidatus Jorgensenbacteria bacterium RIFCSPLOWO2_02_FULL_45_12]|uniref:Cell division protein FtsL n=1 Tax=Candidatus Jorgensenbacteria bacterium RIFCSPHIGHO2_02_FULL_45_20 TaxID=1798470 RepID=A0A1F6BPE3_9BACT|nr:MAG: hypothetical protein A3D55_01905 [Candidatus Jorgensenbacteria bacterium RIFCSPHIGHO2_02_FULL_45_20]OGG42537.1 MAG: hypothetical protein A3I34_02745 [Candidatus Jorgensenbacteria bacterium RIFCSPLOWO2_02_FULL_45_12]